MKELSSDIVRFFKNQHFVIVSTLDAGGAIHNSAKAVIGVEPEGKVYLVDIYLAHTFNNLKKNSTISITAVDEAQFIGYTLKGTGAIVDLNKVKKHIQQKWEDLVIKRISKRVMANIKKERTSSHHPESKFTPPQYLIEVDVAEVIDLTPSYLKK